MTRDRSLSVAKFPLLPETKTSCVSAKSGIMINSLVPEINRKIWGDENERGGGGE